MSQLEAKAVSLGYDQALIIEELELVLAAGEITALEGPNGCGKSTLLRGLSRLLKPRAGAVYLDGEMIQKMPARALARRLGILPQRPEAPAGLTVYELVAQGRYPHQGFLRHWSEADEAATLAALRTTNLEALAERPLDTLSGGQRQRAWIAMALAQETEILLLDEPTTFLDLAYQIEILDLLATLNEAGRTIVMVLHDLNQACRYAGQLIAMREGQVVAEGTPAAIMDEALVRRVFGLEARIIPDPVTGTPLVVPIGRAPAPQPVVAWRQNGARVNGNRPVRVR